MTSVAIVIPTLNRATLLRGAIGSALRCEPAPTEILVVDCGSSDDTRAVVRSFGNDVELVERDLPNAASARNLGLEATQSPYVGFLDSDDEACRGKTGRLAATLDAFPDVSLVHGSMEVITGEGDPLPGSAVLYAKARAKALKVGTGYPGLASACSMYTSATLLRRSSFEEVGGYDESLDAYEDWDMYLRLALKSRLLYDDAAACRYRVWNGNVPWDKTARGLVQVARKHLRMLPDLPLEMRREAELGLRIRLAGSLYTLLELPEAKREALEVLALNPRAALCAPEIRRVLTRFFAPTFVLERRRPGGWPRD